MEVKRYGVSITTSDHSTFWQQAEKSDGEFVLYTDHAAALAEATEKAWREGAMAGLIHADVRWPFSAELEKEIDAIVSKQKGAPPL